MSLSVIILEITPNKAFEYFAYTYSTVLRSLAINPAMISCSSNELVCKKGTRDSPCTCKSIQPFLISQMDYFIIRRRGGFHDSFRHRGMRMNGFDNFMAGGLQLPNSHYFGY